QRHELEASRVVAPGEVVVGEPSEIVRSFHGEPADVVRLELRHELAPDVDEAGAPRREQPLLRAAREDVDRCRAQVERERSESLDGVDDEVDTTLAAERS